MQLQAHCSRRPWRALHSGQCSSRRSCVTRWRIPIFPPLSSAPAQVGVSEGRLRKWLLSISACLRMQNASVADAIQIWKDNVEKEFEGANYVLPRPPCKNRRPRRMLMGALCPCLLQARRSASSVTPSCNPAVAGCPGRPAALAASGSTAAACTNGSRAAARTPARIARVPGSGILAGRCDRHQIRCPNSVAEASAGRPHCR